MGLSKEALLQKYSVRKQTDDSYADSFSARKTSVKRGIEDRMVGKVSGERRRSREFKIHVAPSI